jgi:hypothetical protein
MYHGTAFEAYNHGGKVQTVILKSVEAVSYLLNSYTDIRLALLFWQNQRDAVNLWCQLIFSSGY